MKSGGLLLGGGSQHMQRPWRRWQRPGDSAVVKWGWSSGQKEPLHFVANAVDTRYSWILNL